MISRCLSRLSRAALSSLAGLLLLSAVPAIQSAHAASGAEHARSTSREAQALLQKAGKYLEANGPEKAFAAFNNRSGPFVHKDLYVFVIDQQGVYQANGAAPATLVGLNVLETKDAAGNPLFHNMLDAVKNQADAQVRYVWLDRATNKVEPKVTFLHRSGDYVLGVGYYAPRSTPEDARQLLGKAVSLVNAQGMAKAAKAFDDSQGAFVREDLYVFAVGLESGRFEAMGMNPKLVGSDARELRDVEGHAMIQDMIDLAKSQGVGTVDYIWRNPVTNAVEKKRSFIRRAGNSLVGVGYYRE